MNKKSPYQIGTRVRIINPEFFVRCGYPETLQSAKEKFRERFKEKHDKELNRFLDDLVDIDGERKLDGILFTGNHFREWELEKIVDIFARAYNREFLRFGGTERKVYTERKPEYEDEIMYIQPFDHPLIKKSGVYVRGAGSTIDYYGEYDYDPSYLDKVKTHVFYPVGMFQYKKDSVSGLRTLMKSDADYIEKTNFEILDDEDNDELFEG